MRKKKLVPVFKQFHDVEYPTGMAIPPEANLSGSDVLTEAREAAEVHRQVRKKVRNFLHPGIKASDLADYIEKKIHELVGYKSDDPLSRGIGFPIGISINECAAHWNPNPMDQTVIGKNDVVKIDIGVHVNGTIIDSAFTMSFDEKYDNLLESSREATWTGIKAAGPDAILSEIGEQVQEVMESYEVEIDGKVYPIKSVRDLTGHSIERYKIHAGKMVPNIRGIQAARTLRMESGEFFAIETFASTGNGKVNNGIDCSHYMLNYQNGYSGENIPRKEKSLLRAIEKQFGTLAFCRRWMVDDSFLSQLDGDTRYQILLHNLVRKNIVIPYPPLYDVKGSYVAQFEHTIHIKENGVEVLSHGEDY